jgi:peptide/nickel transport system permease protein
LGLPVSSPVVLEEQGAANSIGREPLIPGEASYRSKRFEFLYFALRSKKLIFGVSILFLFSLAALFGPLFVKHAPLAYGVAFQRPSTEYWFGTNYFGQDVFSQFIYGLRESLEVGLLGGGLAFVVGSVIGFVMGYRGGLVDETLNVVTNVLLTIPSLVLLILVGGFLKQTSVLFEGVFIGLTNWTWAARAIRAQTFSLVNRDFVDLARLSGEKPRRILFREIAPNMSSYLFLVFILLFGGSILTATSFDFLGFGPTNGMSLGIMMNQASSWNALPLHLWWWFVPPGAAITLIVGSLYVANAGLDEVFNPKLRAL